MWWHNINTPIEAKQLGDLRFFVKRDDLIHPEYSGNKARKLWYFLDQDLHRIKGIVSFGSNQSNAMYSLSALAKLKQLEFIYYTFPLPLLLKNNPLGNLKASIQNGMQIREIEREEQIEVPQNYLFIEQGGAMPQAETGVKKLADELATFIDQQNLGNIPVFLPSGTGATALYLQKNLANKVYTVACVGTPDYLMQQFGALESDTSVYPRILETSKRYYFAQPRKELLQIWQQLKKATDIEFDLIYDPVGWIAILEHPQIFSNPFIYVHCGGLPGNETMLGRYRWKKML